jgi:hypothetical protein
MENEKRKKEKKNLERKISFRVTGAEYEKLEKDFQKTVYRKFSEYLRQVLIKKEVIVYERNGSMDDFLEELSDLQYQLRFIGINYNQAVKKLNSLNRIPEFKTWLQQYENIQRILLHKIGKINSRIEQFADLWWQE